MNNKSVLVVGICLMAGAVSVSAEPYVYPNKGQSPQQMEKDKYQCYGWAKGQTGYDPMNPPGITAHAAPQGSILGGAARGAAGGALIGAIAGDAGKGVAIGAGVGAVGRGLRNRSAQNQQVQAQDQQAARISQMHSEYNRAYAVCLEGRGYSVE